MTSPDGQTRLYGIFGDPVSHSLSPQMQNAAMRKAGINACYLPFHVVPEQLEQAVSALRVLDFGGVNITLPHKQNVITYLDRVDEDALLIGAVNTVVNREGLLYGYNTDAGGFLRAIKEGLGFNPQRKTVLLFGAGGACRAAVVALLRSGAQKLVLVNRDRAKALALLEQMRPIFPEAQLRTEVAGSAEFEAALSDVDLVVNTTSIGLRGEPFTLCPVEKIEASASVYDMVYSVGETPLVQAARRLGLSAADGIGMLAGQGEEAFALWFNQQPQEGLMKNCLMQLSTPRKS